MFNLPVIDNIIERFTPHAMTIRDECRSWALAITDRLDLIADGITGDDDMREHRVYMRPVILVGGGTASVVVQDIPPNEEWHLEYWSGSGDTVSSLRLFDNPALSIANLDNPVALLSVTAIGGFDAKPGNGVVLQGGQSICVQPGNAGNYRLFMQWRVKRPRTTRPNVSAGMRNGGAEVIGAGQQLETEHRHVGQWGLGAPIFGGGAPTNGHGASS